MVRRSLLMLGCALLAAPGCAHASRTVWLRIRNDSTELFEHVWLGLPQLGSDADLGPLAPGQMSRWHALPADPAAHYRKTRIQLGRRQIIHVNDGAYPHARNTLSPGRSYTFAYTLAGTQARLAVIDEGAQQPAR